MEIEEKIKKLVENVIIDNNYILDNIIYEKEGNINFLRIIIDKKGTMDVEDCVKVSNLINPILDEADPIEENYILDVCSKEKGCD
jgi:ribosome maturation factor RimP